MTPLLFFSCFQKNLLYLSIVDLCCANFCYTTVIQLYIYAHYFSCKLNKYKYTALSYSFPSFDPGSRSLLGSNCCFLTCIQVAQEVGKEVWYSHLLMNFPQFVVIHTVKGFSVVNGAEVDVFLSIDHKAPKAWKCTSWSFTGNLCPPCPRALLF